MVAVLKSLVEEEPFHSSSVIDAESETCSSLMANLGFLSCDKEKEVDFFKCCQSL